MEPATTLRFAMAARRLAAEARARGLVAPSFRSPPRLPGADRTLRRRAGRGPTVAVRLQGRPWPAILADMVEGVVVVNPGRDADEVRAAMWSSVADCVASPSVAAPARVA